MTLSTRNAVILFAIVGAVAATLWVLGSRTSYAWRQERMVKRVVAADPAELLSAGRTLLANRPGFVGRISLSSPDVPSAIHRLRPTLISMSTNSLRVDFSDVFNPFGIIVYSARVNPLPKPKFGIAPLKWIDGLWLYDDGQLDNYGQPDGPANRSQPVQSVTKSTPLPAGSGR